MCSALACRLAGSILDVIAPRRCAGCGEPGSALCEACVDAIEATPQPALTGARAAFAYGSEVRRVLHHGKFRDCRAALRSLAWMGAARLARARAAERGYNQADVVAGALAGFHRLPRAQLLTRVRDTPPQSTLDRSARRENVAGAFAASQGAAGRTVWLVDDVLTTGATTDAAKRALEEGGAARVEIAVLASVL
jgi:predicted amidophosphoribosyltransferase